MPQARIGCSATVVVAVNQDEFMVVGGSTASSYNTNQKGQSSSLSSPSTTTLLYNIRTKSWSVLPGLRKERVGAACVCVNQKIYTIGGSNANNNEEEEEDGDLCENTIEVLDLAVPSRGWTLLPTRMKQGRYGCAAVVDYRGDILIIGGYNHNHNHNNKVVLLNSIEVFDTRNQVFFNSAITTTTRSLQPPMLSGRCGHGAITLNNGRILVVLGGKTIKDGASTTAELLILDDDGNRQWTPLPSMKTGRKNFAAIAAVMKATSEEGILVAGGLTQNL